MGQFLFCLIVYYIILYYNSLEAQLFSNVRQKGDTPSCEERWGGTGRNRWRGNRNQDIIYKEKNPFSITGKEYFKKNKNLKGRLIRIKYFSNIFTIIKCLVGQCCIVRPYKTLRCQHFTKFSFLKVGLQSFVLLIPQVWEI